METNINNRGSWSSKLGFILAASGSAIGLGNVWRFPYLTGENGGAVFVIIYIFCVLIIGFPIMLAEVSIGRNTQSNTVGAYEKLAPKTKWKYVGILGVITGFGILSFYSVVAGYTVGYLFKTIFGEFSNIQSPQDTKQIFINFVSNPYFSFLCLSIFLFFNGYIVYKGVEKGIEKWSKMLMPLLFLLLVYLVIRSVMLEGSVKGLEFYLKPDFSKVSGSTFINALGQALFSLSLGMGTMLTYGSYMSRKENLVSSVSYVCIFDTLVAFVAGLVIFPALFAMGIQPNEGPDLVFIVFPSIFSKIGGGVYFGTIFFILLILAAITSTISQLEVIVAYVVEELKISRKKAAVGASIIAFLLAIPSVLAGGMIKFFTKIPVYEKDFLTFMSNVFGSYALVIGALFISIFVGWKWGVSNALQEVLVGNPKFKSRVLWNILIKYISPVAIFLILLNLIKSSFF